MIFFNVLSYYLISLILNIVLTVKYFFCGKSVIYKILIAAVYGGFVFAFLTNRKAFFIVLGIYVVGQLVWDYPFLQLNHRDMKRDNEKVRKKRLIKKSEEEKEADISLRSDELSFEERLELLKNCND